MEPGAKMNETDVVSEKVHEWLRFWQSYLQRLGSVSRYALSDVRKGACLLNALRCDRYDVQRRLRKTYRYDAGIGRFLPRQAPTFTDTRQISFFFSYILNWTVLNQAVVSAENVLLTTGLAMTPAKKFRLAVRRALARLCTTPAHLALMMDGPLVASDERLEFIRVEALAAFSAWTIAKVSLERNADLKKMLSEEEGNFTEQPDEPSAFKQLVSRLPGIVFEAFRSAECSSSLPREVAEKALLNLGEGRPLTAGGDPAVNRVVRLLERELRGGQWVKRWEKSKVRYVPLPENIADNLQLYEAAFREVDFQGLSPFVERALMLLTSGEKRVFLAQVSNPYLKAVEIAGVLEISEPAVSQHLKHIHQKLTQAGLKDLAWEQLG